ncbi:MAG: SDR family NAD(P)-dependent oxidoreductase [Porticoccaceae bacterium]|jgi:NAD(P)-dependent dehydrogenase (short-subunit alcohol dehydrogenase family)|nr:SDR family NAD(P)-dependent oxidoreductase [Porticoccaceae bacterium]
MISADRCALVLGASGGLGSAMVSEFLNDPEIDKVFAVSSKKNPVGSNEGQNQSKLVWLQAEYSETQMADAVSQLMAHAGTFSRVCVCHGLLHSDKLWPEKRLEDITSEALQEIFHSNTVVPALWLKLLFKILKGQTPCIVATMSARVGSLSDNNLGGWYAYRASKAALNMVLKTASIEYGRRAKNVKLIAFHPGTTDTALSKPFQSTVPTGKLFTTEFVAEQLAMIMDSAQVDGELSYLDWDGQTIAW